MYRPRLSESPSADRRSYLLAAISTCVTAGYLDPGGVRVFLQLEAVVEAQLVEVLVVCSAVPTQLGAQQLEEVFFQHSDGRHFPFVN